MKVFLSCCCFKGEQAEFKCDGLDLLVHQNLINDQDKLNVILVFKDKSCLILKLKPELWGWHRFVSQSSSFKASGEGEAGDDLLSGPEWPCCSGRTAKTGKFTALWALSSPFFIVCLILRYAVWNRTPDGSIHLKTWTSRYFCACKCKIFFSPSLSWWPNKLEASVEN